MMDDKESLVIKSLLLGVLIGLICGWVIFAGFLGSSYRAAYICRQWGMQSEFIAIDGEYADSYYCVDGQEVIPLRIDYEWLIAPTGKARE